MIFNVGTDTDIWELDINHLYTTNNINISDY